MMRWPFVSRRERLRREASDWVAKFNGPHDSSDREAFEHWYSKSPDHAESYDRIAALFAAAGAARRPVREGIARTQERRPLLPRYAMAAGALAAAVLVLILLSGRATLGGQGPESQIATYDASGGGRRLALADGSTVELAAGSALEVSLGRDSRNLRLTRGEARFSVAHETRPFIVVAGAAEVTARGTRFLVRVADGGTSVTLFQGAVDVAYRPARGGGSGERVTRLEPGQSLTVRSAGGAAGAPAAGPRTMLELHSTPVAEAIEQVGGEGSIRLADPALGRLRVTGAFPAGDRAGFARSLAAAFDLRLETGADGTIWLHPAPRETRRR
jgi:transmembrane sensor